MAEAKSQMVFMNVSNVRGRFQRANKNQLVKLIDYMYQNPDLARGSKSSECKDKWENLTDELNTLGTMKSVGRWQTTWRDIKSKALGRASKLKRNNKEGFLILDPPLTEQEKQICVAVGAGFFLNKKKDTTSLTEEEELQQRLGQWDDVSMKNEENTINQFEVINFDDLPIHQRDGMLDYQDFDVDGSSQPEPNNKEGPFISNVTSLATGSSNITRNRPTLFQKRNKTNRKLQYTRTIRNNRILEQQNETMKLFAEAAMRQADAAKTQADAAMMQAEAAVKQADAGKDLARAVILQAENERRRLDHRAKYEGLLLNTLQKLTVVLERS